MLEQVKTISEIIINITVIIAGIMALPPSVKYIKKLHEKKNDAVYCYLAQLLVYLRKMYFFLKENTDVINARFLPKGQRDNLPERIKKESWVKQNVPEQAKEFIEFLKRAPDQFPASNNWTSMYNDLIVFLMDLHRISDDNWNKRDEQHSTENDINKYVISQIDNMKTMIEDILNVQNDLANKLYHPTLYNVFTLWICQCPVIIKYKQWLADTEERLLSKKDSSQ